MKRKNQVLLQRKPLVIRLRTNYLQLFSWHIPLYKLRIAIDWHWVCLNLPFQSFWLNEYQRWRAWHLLFFFSAIPFAIFYTKKTLIRGGHIAPDTFSIFELWGLAAGLFLSIRLLFMGIQRIAPSAVRTIMLCLKWSILLICISALLYSISLK